MNTKVLRRISKIGYATLLIAFCASAQEHKWAGRTLDDFEWGIHERLAVLPAHAAFETLNFETRDKTVTLSGHVLRESLKQNAERSVRQAPGVEDVVNDIEVLPPSRRDDALRANVYRAVYDAPQLAEYHARAGVAPIQIIVKNGWVTLEGVVDSPEDRTLVHFQTLKVASHVSDNLRVAPRQ